jgi:hypothetical protein
MTVNGDSIGTKTFGKRVAGFTLVDLGKGRLSSEKFPFPNISNPFKVSPSWRKGRKPFPERLLPFYQFFTAQGAP